MAKSKLVLITDWFLDQFIYPLFEGSQDKQVVNDRISFTPAAKSLAPIPWPAGLAPVVMSSVTSNGKLPAADVLVITWTAAEAMALADVLTPGIISKSWVYYKNNWDKFASQLTGRSPAKFSKRLGSFHMTQIGNKRVCCFKSELHPATDAASVPTAELVAQIVAETGAKLVITTGTAGGAGNGTLLGDVCVATGVRADFTRRLSGLPWAGKLWATTPLPLDARTLVPLFAANADRIPSPGRPPKIWNGHVVSTDFFAYDTDTDAFGLRKLDQFIRAVEMDDAAVAFGIGDTKVQFTSVRNASDPVMPDDSKASAKLAASIYRKYGYWTTVNSAITVWGLIAGAQK